MRHDRLAELQRRYEQHPGRGGCGVGAIVDLTGEPSHELVKQALSGLFCLEHRGGQIDDTGDGAGILLGTDRKFFERFIAQGRRLPDGQQLSVGVLFFPRGEQSNIPHWQREIDALLRRHGLQPLGWRHVPVDPSALGAKAEASRREIWQVLVGEGMVAVEDLPSVMFRVKALLERQVRDVYVASFSARTLVYKALTTGEQLVRFYKDLSDPTFRSDSAVFHRRYSTNTFSNWYLAQTFRTLGHNGEINTIKGNRNAVQNLEAELVGLGSILMPQGSDSADMDRMVELFTSHGVSLPEALARMMPMAWRDLPRLAPETGRFFRGVQRALGSLGAWEGPAAIVATDGEYLVGALDRMGLRPLRWVLTRSKRLVISSEAGSIPVPFEDIEESGQLDPGEAIGVDLRERRVLRPAELLTRVVSESPINFAELSEHRLIPLSRGKWDEAPSTPAPKPDPAVLNLFGWAHARIRNVESIAKEGKEPITSMGYDRPLPPFSALRPPLTKYFKQIVAVVTNPPLDPIREDGAFDLTVHLGAAPIVQETLPVYDALPQFKLPSPILTEAQFAQLRTEGADRPKAVTLDCTFEDPGEGHTAGAKALSRRIAEICRAGLSHVKKGEASILILSDRAAYEAVGSTGRARLPLPALFVASALHNLLVQEGRRRHAGILVETGEVQEGHDAAVLIANGADAVFPYVYFQVGLPHGPLKNLVSGIDESIKRIMSKMGILSVDGYRGSRNFEAVGIAPELIEHYLPGITSRLGGLSLEDIFDDLRARHALGKNTPREPEAAVYRKEIWQELQATARGEEGAYERFLGIIAETPPVYLRDLLKVRQASIPLHVDDVVTEEALIRQCLRGAAMSHGALHRVAHRAIAAAFNQFGAMSNCGEGGEDNRREVGGPWEESRSRIRQVGSGRFGVDARYLVNADELSIKIGQGAKPGEGGMLPAAKVNAEVAAIRKTQVGVALISPPPHHDIYSIEDLAQLIYDLRQVNPSAAISVKIPAVTDIGTIAVGIAKAGADVIDISGFEGGTGAAAASSIEHAGLPLERALSEAHQALVINGIRERVRIRADGGIKTGFDVFAALALGADEVSLGTALMVAEQCIYCHGCGDGMCPAGITTQSDLVARRLMTEKKRRPKDDLLSDDEEHRYADAKAGVTRYLRALAKDLRRHLAAAGVRSPAELVGRVHSLERRELQPEAEENVTRKRILYRAQKLDLAEILTDVGARGGAAPKLKVDPTSAMNARLIGDLKSGAQLSYDVTTGDRTVGATLAGLIAKKQLASSADIRLRGYVGQSLGFGNVEGMRIELTGIANDKVAEAMSGGTVVIRTPQTESLSLCGNAAAYGATGGRLFIAGRAGQRVGVRNSGAEIVVEGAGKYAFEYMTGGVGVVLGPIGPVIGSGLTGGVVYVLAAPEVTEKVHSSAKVVPMDDADEARLRSLLEAHVRETGSTRGRELLEHFSREKFVKIAPK